MSLIGRRVILNGLQARQDLNKQKGVAIDYDKAKGRYVIKLDQMGGIQGNVLLKPEKMTELQIGVDEPAWRAEDSYYYKDIHRVTPIIEQQYADAIKTTGMEVSLINNGEGSAEIRTTESFLATPFEDKSCVRFVVNNIEKLTLSIQSRAGSAVSQDIDDLHDGMEICVALAIGDSTDYLRKFWMLIWKNGIPEGIPYTSLCCSYCVSFPERTRTLSGVEVVAEYMSGSDSQKKELRNWQGLYIHAVLDSPGATLRMIDPKTTPSSIDYFAPIRHQQWNKKLLASAAKGIFNEVRQAVSNGADVNYKESGSGMTAVHWAVQENHVNVLRFLVQETQCDINALDNEDWPALIVAVDKQQVECVRILVGPRPAGGEPCDPNIRMEDGSTALIRAAEQSIYTDEDDVYEIVLLLRNVGASNDPGPPPVGPQFHRIALEGHGWDSNNKYNQVAECRFAQSINKKDLTKYPARWLYNMQRTSEVNYAMLGMAEYDDGPCYVHMTSQDHWWRMRWFPRNYWFARAGDRQVIDTVHPYLQRPTNGQNLLDKADVFRAAGPHVTALFLHCASDLTPADVLDLINKCPNLIVLSLTECNINDEVIKGIARSGCASNLIAIRLWLNEGTISWMAVNTLIEATKNQLKWIDIENPTNHQDNSSAAIDHTTWISTLGLCYQLRVAFLPRGVPSSAIGSLSGCQQLELLSVDGSNMPLSSLEPIVQAGFINKLDIHGFYLDPSCSAKVCSLANRLYVKAKDYDTFPREKVLACSNLVEIHIMCNVTKEDVFKCLSKIDNLRSLHLELDVEETAEPELIESLEVLENLRCLNLASCLGNYYMNGEDVHDENSEALIGMAHDGSLNKLVQLDLSSHYDAFYACVDDNAHDTLVTLACKLNNLRVLNLSQNGEKFPWSRLRYEMKCINEEDDHAGGMGLTTHYGDDVTVWSRGGGASGLND